MSALADIVTLAALDPETVCNEAALLACALLSVGVREHPQFRFTIHREEVEGKVRELWKWVFTTESADGLYKTADLMKWWKDESWLAANPRHEWTIVRRVLLNMGGLAAHIKKTIPRAVVRKGNTAVYIPETAPPELRTRLLKMLNGELPFNAPFTEEAA